MLLAAEEYPTLKPAHYLDRLATIAAQVRAVSATRTSASQVIDAINVELFGHAGLRGNQEDYYDPRNSFLNEVLDRKLGLPIALSVIYLDICWRVGLTAVGIGLPGHFIVAVLNPRPILLDPFESGRRLTEADCSARVRQLSSGRMTFHAGMLASLPRRQIIARMLNNLKNVYVQRGDFGRAYAAIDRLALVTPDDPAEVRDRGAIAHQFGFDGKALADFHEYLRRRPGSADRAAVGKLVAEIEAQPRWRN